MHVKASLTAKGYVVRNARRRDRAPDEAARPERSAEEASQLQLQQKAGAPLEPHLVLPLTELRNDGHLVSAQDLLPEPMPAPAAQEVAGGGARQQHPLRITIPESAEYVLESGPPAPCAGLAASARELLLALGGGTGATIGGTGSLVLDQALARRMRLQDEVVLVLLMVVYLTTLSVSAVRVHQQSGNNSRTTYYADPRFHHSLVQGHDVAGFLEAFNQAPKGVQLRVVGFAPTAVDTPGTVYWRGGGYSVAFSFSLDLSAWAVRGCDSGFSASAGAVVGEVLEDGIVAEDLANLREFLAGSGNDLATVELHKVVLWANWEELACNIKQRIRQCGFDGLISIERTDEELLTVYKNKQWANFMHSKSLKVILALTFMGWLLYIPYMWLRVSKLRVRSFHRIDISIGDYWRLIADNLTASGFQTGDHGQPQVDASAAPSDSGAWFDVSHSDLASHDGDSDPEDGAPPATSL